jgi:hypothetical protein
MYILWEPATYTARASPSASKTILPCAQPSPSPASLATPWADARQRPTPLPQIESRKEHRQARQSRSRRPRLCLPQPKTAAHQPPSEPCAKPTQARSRGCSIPQPEPEEPAFSARRSGPATSSQRTTASRMLRIQRGPSLRPLEPGRISSFAVRRVRGPW